MIDTNDAVRRLLERKKISVQMKQQTQDSGTVDNQLLKSILRMSQQITPLSNTFKQDTQNKTSTFDQQKFNTRNNANNKPTNSKGDLITRLFQVANKNDEKHFSVEQSINNGIEDSAFTGKTYQQLTPAEQINIIKIQNFELEQQVNILKQKLSKLEQIQKQARQQQWRDGLPYFIINIPKIKVFYTKLNVAQRDYDKIDYNFYSVDLTLQKIVLAQQPSSNTQKRAQKSITLMLSDLKEVKYMIRKNSVNQNLPTSILIKKPKQEQQQILLVYYFKHQTQINVQKKQKHKKSLFMRQKIQDHVKQEDAALQIVQTLFMKFDNQQQYKQWDLAFFINYKIVEDLNKNNLKALQSNNSMNSSAIFGQQSNIRSLDQKKRKQSTNSVQFSDLINKYNQKKNGGSSSPKNQKNQNYFNNYNSHSSQQQKNDKNKNGETLRALQKLNSNAEQKFQQISPRIDKQNNNIKIREQDQFKMHQNVEEETTKQRSDTSHFGGLNSQGLSIEQKVKLAEIQKIQSQQAKKQKIIDAQQQKRKQAERMEAMRKTQFQLSIRKAKQSLKRGYIMTKYAKSAMHPYEKKIFLHEDGKRLCWQDLKTPGQLKWILINDILNVIKGAFGKGVQAHLNVKKISKKGCFVLINLDSKNRQSLQLSCKDELTTDQFCKDLQLYRKVHKQKDYT